MILAFLEPFVAYLELWYVFWPLLIILTAITIGCLPRERPEKTDQWEGHTGIALIANILIFVIVLYKLGVHVSMWELYVPVAVGYLIIGSFWSALRWRVFLGGKRDFFVAEVTRWAAKNGFNYSDVKTEQISGERMGQFYSYIFHSGVQFYKTLPYPNNQNFVHWPELVSAVTPNVGDHKSAILARLVCWPMSVLRWLVADMISDLLNGIFESMRDRLQGMAISVFKDV